MSNAEHVNKASGKTAMLSARCRPSFRKRVEAVQEDRGDKWLSDTVLTLLREGVERHERARLDRAA